ncbi:hypothetical protein P4E94_00135 [Pontiellaceae bacterium B12219]|nr:hypothetical protein [Pontiellaceae bacterium B12219]
MRLYVYLLCVSAVLPSAAQADTSHLDIARSSRETASLQGPVMKVEEEYAYELSDRKYREIRAYDEAGNLKYRKKFNYKDELTYFATNTFNEAGCMIRQRVEDIRHGTTNDYDIVLNVPTRQMAYQCRITGDIEIVTYNPDRCNTSTTIKRKRKKPLPYSKYKRDSDNVSLSYTRYDEDGRVKYVSVYRHDDQQRLTRAAISYKQEDRKDLNEYEYLAVDAYGNWTQRLLKIKTIQDGTEKNYDKFSTRTIEYYPAAENENEPL